MSRTAGSRGDNQSDLGGAGCPGLCCQAIRLLEKLGPDRFDGHPRSGPEGNATVTSPVVHGAGPSTTNTRVAGRASGNASKGIYGVPRSRAELAAVGHRHGRRTPRHEVVAFTVRLFLGDFVARKVARASVRSS